MHRRLFITLLGMGTFGCCIERSDPLSSNGSPTTTPSSISDEASETPPSTTSSSEDVTLYQELSMEGQQLFKKILKNGAITALETDLPSHLWEAKYVEYTGIEYMIKKTTQQSIAEYSLSTNRIEKTAIEDTLKAIAFENLPVKTQRMFKTALDDEYTSQNILPDQLQANDYVQYQGDYYKLQIAIADIRVWKLTVAKKSTTLLTN